MKTTLYALTIVFGLTGALISCNENDTPSNAQVKLAIKATTSSSAINKSGRTTNTELVFNEILLGVTELEFETLEEDELEEDHDAVDGENHDGEEENEEIEFEGQFTVDLVHGTSTPDFGVAAVLPGLYEEMEIELGPILEDGNSIFIAFSLPRQGAEMLNIEYSSSDEMEFEIERDAGFRLDAGATNQMLVLFNLNLIFAGVDFSQAVVDADGVIRINKSSNTHLASLIEANLDHACDAGEDQDGDEEIDED